MGGGCNVDDQEFASALTLVLVGKTGNGKSATGNSILGTKSFQSRRSSSGVTIKSEWKTTKMQDGRVVNVIDTPGLFDISADPGFIWNEIVSCIHMARDGIHAVLVVFSICNRFSEEERAVICGLVDLFGNKIYDYMIIVFTCGDELDEDGKSLDEFLSGCSEQLKEVLCLCGNRCVLFDNRSKDEAKKLSQVHELLSQVNMVLDKNGGKPYSSEIFAMFKKEFAENESLTLNDKQLKPLIELLESKFIEIELKLKKLLEEEQAARLKAEMKAIEVKKKCEENVQGMKEQLDEATEALKHWRCSIM
ncbi:putative AIG1-type guanine nucleotide-binding (G) domain-containing protein [Helianthus annuus]|uniref:AIG1-type guanine nucleotide-binding (G) domain-containing protein n=2 Tax=Helianthus annuus TaxID=4232 RepID=A0A9K3JL37_HELAN|nr:immune-associated nucleotide-binding protein 9 [Helianthus annuus]KAF5817423.1 putative AIG1-type guanine nucleotide-binding (G) domain-containing protein [Helianthus annuus]